MTPLFFSSFMGKIAATSALVLSLTTITDAAFTHGHSCKPCDDGTMDTCVIKASVNLYAGATGKYCDPIDCYGESITVDDINIVDTRLLYRYKPLSFFFFFFFFFFMDT